MPVATDDPQRSHAPERTCDARRSGFTRWVIVLRVRNIRLHNGLSPARSGQLPFLGLYILFAGFHNEAWVRLGAAKK